MIKWIRARLYNGCTDEMATGHVFECGERRFVLRQLEKDSYPPFDCVKLTQEDAIELKDFLQTCIDSNGWNQRNIFTPSYD